MIKKLLLPMCIIVGFGTISYSHAKTFILKHDFSYYEQKTRELLPVLGINETDVTFAATHKEISPEQRMKEPNTIFLDLKALNTLPDSMAFFECAVSAQLTKLDWKKINDLKPQASSAAALLISLSVALPCSVPIILSIQDAKYIHASLWALGACMGCTFCYLTWRSDQKKDAAEKPKQMAHELMLQELWLRFGTFYTLFNHPETTHIAIMGIPSIAVHKSKVIQSLEGFSAILGLTIINEWEKLLMRFQHWGELHPQEWQHIQEQLDAEKAAWERLLKQLEAAQATLDVKHGNEKTDEQNSK